MHYKICLYAGLVMLLVLGACRESASGDTGIRTITEMAYADLITQRHGKVLVIHFWATWNEDYAAAIPAMNELYTTLRKRQVEMISVCADGARELDVSVRPYVKANQIHYPVRVTDFQEDQSFIDMIDPQWSGALPVTMIYDDQGRRTAFFEGLASSEEILKALP